LHLTGERKITAALLFGMSTGDVERWLATRFLYMDESAIELSPNG
jgi:hypothetical protein